MANYLGNMSCLGDVTIGGGLTVAGATLLNGTATTRNVTVRSGSLLLLDAAASTAGNPEVDSAIARFNTTAWNGTQNTLGTIDVYGTTDSSGPYLRVHGSVYGDAEVAGFTLRSQTTVLGASGVYDGAAATSANRVYSPNNPPPNTGSVLASPMLGLQVMRDTGLGHTAQTIPGSTFTALSYSGSTRNDFGTGWDGTVLTIPADGHYLLMARVRVPDALANGTSAGVGFGTTVGDNSDFNWTTKGPTRGTFDVQHTRYYAAGTTIRAFMFSDVATTIAVSYMQVIQLRGIKGDTGASGNGANGEVASYLGPPADLTVGNTANVTSMTVSWNSIAGHKYKITAYTTVDTNASTGALDVHFDVPGQAAKFLIFSNAPAVSTPYYGSAVGEFTETVTQTRSLPLYIIRFGTGATATVRANSTMLNVEDITPGSSLVVAPSSNAPAQNVVAAQVLGGGPLMNLTITPVAVPLAVYTVPVSGTYHVTSQMDAIWNTGDPGLVGEVYVDGAIVSTGRSQAFWFGATNGSRATVVAIQTIALNAGQVLTFRVSKGSGTGSSQVVATSTGFTLMLPGTGNLDSDALNLMGAL